MSAWASSLPTRLRGQWSCARQVTSWRGGLRTCRTSKRTWWSTRSTLSRGRRRTSSSSPPSGRIKTEIWAFSLIGAASTSPSPARSTSWLSWATATRSAAIKSGMTSWSGLNKKKHTMKFPPPTNCSRLSSTCSLIPTTSQLLEEDITISARIFVGKSKSSWIRARLNQRKCKTNWPTRHRNNRITQICLPRISRQFFLPILLKFCLINTRWT